MDKGNFDGKLFTLLLLRNYKKVLIAILLGALIIGVPYTLSKTVIGNFTYRSEITVHVDYGEDSAGNMYDYINFYTWGQWITSDNFVATIVEEYGLQTSVSEEDLKKSLGATVPADQRVVVFTVTTDNRGKTDLIAAAVADSIIDLVTSINEVESATLLSRSETVKYFVYKNIPQAFVFGALTGLFVSVFALWVTFLLDDSVYIPELFEKETGLKVSDETSECEVVVERKLPDLSDIKDGLTLSVKCGAHNGKAVGYVIHECEKRGITIKNARLLDVDGKLVAAYYRGSKFPNPFMNGQDD